MPDEHLLKILVSFGLDDKAAGEAAERIEQLGKKTEESGEAAHHANVHHREMHMLFSQMNQLMPGLGHAMHAAFMGELGAIIIVVEAIKVVTEKVKAYNEELDKAAAKNATADTGGIQAVQTAWDNAAKALGDYVAAMKTAGGDTDAIKTQIDREKELTKARLDGIKEEMEALEALVILRMKASGATPEQIEQEKRLHQQKVDQIQQQMDVAAGSGALVEEQAKRTAAAPKLDAAAQAAQKALAGSQFKTQQDEMESLRKQWTTPEGTKDFVAKRDKAEAAITAAESRIAIGKAIGDTGIVEVNQALKAKAEEELNQLIAEQKAALTRLHQLEASEAERSAKEKELQDKAATTAKASEDNQARLAKLPDEIKQAQAVEGEKSKATKGTEATAEAGAALGVDKATADAIVAGKVVSREAASRLIADASQIAGHQVNLAQAVQMMENGAKNMQIFMNQVGRLAAVFANWKPDQIQKLEQQIAVIQAQLGGGGYRTNP